MPSLTVRLALLLPFAALLSSACGGDSNEVATDAGDDAIALGDSLTDGSSDDADANVADAAHGDLGTVETSDASDIGDSSDASDASHPRIGPAPVLLGSAGNYVLFAESAIATVPTSAITGDVALTPAAASFVTGFSMTRVGAYWTSAQVVGKIYAANNDPPTPTLLTTAATEMRTAYTDAASRPTPDFLNLGAGAIGGLTLVPGLYKWTTAVTIATDVTFSGGPNDTWILQIPGDLTEAAGKHVTLIGGARAKNIVWQVAGSVDLGATSHFEGIVLCKTEIALSTGASLDGRLYAQTQISLDGNRVTGPGL